MALAALTQIYLFCVYFIFSINSGILFFILFVGNFSPIVPVEANNISVGLILTGLS